MFKIVRTRALNRDLRRKNVVVLICGLEHTHLTFCKMRVFSHGIPRCRLGQSNDTVKTESKIMELTHILKLYPLFLNKVGGVHKYLQC